MSIVFCKFVAHDGESIFINPLKVRYFCSLVAGKPESNTRIVFDNNHDQSSVMVQSSLAEVLKVLAS